MDNRIRDRSPLPSAGSRPIVRPLPADATKAGAARAGPKWDISFIVPFHVDKGWYEATWYGVAPQPRWRTTVALLRRMIGLLKRGHAHLAWWFTWRNHHRNGAKHTLKPTDMTVAPHEKPT